MSFEFKLSDANAKVLNTAGKYLTDNINIMLDSAVASKIVSGNTILGVAGTATQIKAQDKTTTISAKAATIKPDSGYNSMSSLKYTVADATYAINGGGFGGGDPVTPTITLSLGKSDLTTSGNEAVNIYSGTSGATLYADEAAVKKAGYNYFLEIDGTSSAGSSTVSRGAMHISTSKAGWINSGDSATVNGDSKTVTVNAGSGKKFVGVRTGSVKLNAVTISQGTTTAAISAGTASNEISSKCTASTSAPTDGYFAKLALTSPKVTGTATGTTTAGWISSNPASASVTVNAGSGTAYVKIPAGSTTASASVTTAPAVDIGIKTASTTVSTTTTATSYYVTVSATTTKKGTAKAQAVVKEGYQPGATKEATAEITPTLPADKKVYIQSASNTLYSNSSNSTSGFKTTTTYENTSGYMPSGAKTAYTSTIDTVSGTGTITAVPSGATVNITSNVGTTNIKANTGTVNFVNWKLCNNAADACLDIYF